MKHFFAILLVSLGLSTKGEAATFTSWSTFGALGCQDVASDSSAVSTNCGSASIGGLTAETYGSAGDGIVSAYASAWSNRDNDGFGTFFNKSRTFAIIQDNISATWSSTGQQFNGTASFEIDLLGTIQADSGASANADANLQVNGNTVFSFDSATDTADSISQATFGFTGTSSIFAYINAEARSCNIVASGTTCYSASDLGSSLRLTGISFFDVTGAKVTSQLTVSSDSGFDYVTGASAHARQPGPSPVPLPAAGWLMLLGFSSLGLIRLRQA